MPRILVRPLAKQELEAQAEYIARSNPVAGQRLYAAAEKALALLARAPEMGAPWETENPNVSGLRCWPVPGFPNHLIFYPPIDRGIEVTRILHGAQDIDTLLGR
jgi:toxin ParE1/3/4